jgi:hypothetical protein
VDELLHHKGPWNEDEEDVVDTNIDVQDEEEKDDGDAYEPEEDEDDPADHWEFNGCGIDDESGEKDWDDRPSMRQRQRRLPANVKRNHRGGLLIAIAPNGRTSKVKPAALKPGKQMRGYCIHLVGGTRGNCAMTKLRREAVRAKHAANLGPDGVRCACHVPNWKAISSRS